MINKRGGKCATLRNANNPIPVHLFLRNAFKVSVMAYAQNLFFKSNPTKNAINVLSCDL